jgi:hypothetical protein
MIIILDTVKVLRFFITQCFGNAIYPAISSKIPMELEPLLLQIMAETAQSAHYVLKMVDNVQNNDHSYSYKPMHEIFKLSL